MGRKIKITAFLLTICCTLINTLSVFALGGTWHDPYGLHDIYEIEPTERSPRNPVAGQSVLIRSTTWPVEFGQAVWVSYTVNGVSRSNVGAAWSYNSGNNSYWETNLGSFAKGDVVEYTVYANVNGTNTKSVGPFTFRVTDWEKVSSVSLNSSNNGRVLFNVTPNTGNFSPKLALSFTDAETVRFQLSPKGTGNFASGISNYSVTQNAQKVEIDTGKLRVTVTKNPYALEVFSYDQNRVLTVNGGMGKEMSWLTDGNNVIGQFRDGYLTPPDEHFYGFGERYDGTEKRGEVLETYSYNQYQNQGNKTYLSVPFFVTSRGYGIYLNTTCYSKFDMAATNGGQYVFQADTEQVSSPILDYYLISASTPANIVGKYNTISGLPQELPKWAFGLWMSANEWDTQAETLGAMSQAQNNGIPATVLVLEQWSDENTFYVWNDATYTPVPGSAAFSNASFHYGAKWPNPQAMTNTLHQNGLKLVLWQIPVLKNTPYAYTQKDNDEAYMLQQGYAVSDGHGGAYRIPESGWFGNSLLLDFTNPNAVNWWMNKRAYLFDDIHIDGVKTDGGEMVWRKDTSFYDGSTNLSMRNAYPNSYIKGYNDFVRQKTGEGITFSRSGTSGVQSFGAFWAGDQSSSFSAFRDALSAGLSAGISGVSYWSWDLAGFTGNFPSAELYKRSTQMAAFAPIMQFHSEKANPPSSEERSPWNVQSRTGDNSIVPMFRKYINTRMNLLPYIFSEAQNSAQSGTPMMRAMFLDNPNDVNTYALEEQYMFGQNLLVAPVVHESQTIKSLYLPEGEWIDFWNNALTAGGVTKNYYADVNAIPVYVKSGSILPLNLNNNYEIGGSIGNDVENYQNLTFRVYPDGQTAYTLSHSDRSTMTVQASENFVSGIVTVNLPATQIPITTQVFGTRPSGVSVGGQALQSVSTLAAFVQAQNAYYYNENEKLTYIKTPAGSAKVIQLNGVYKAPYEAEHASFNQVSTNTNHSGYYGDGFVDQFAENGDWVEFQVYSRVSGAATLSVRYAAGVTAGRRTVRVNGGSGGSLALPATSGWNDWNTATISVNLNSGRNTIRISYENGDFTGINLDCILVR